MHHQSHRDPVDIRKNAASFQAQSGWTRSKAEAIPAKTIFGLATLLTVITAYVAKHPEVLGKAVDNLEKLLKLAINQ